ncbi:Protease, partial [Clarias magur]
MASTRRQQSGHWPCDPMDPNTQHARVPTSCVNSPFVLGCLKRSVVSRILRRAEYASRCLLYGRKFQQRALMVQACCLLSVQPVSVLGQARSLPGTVFIHSL